MDVVQYRSTHYDALGQFWAQYGWEAPHEDVLPKTGFTAIDNGKIVGAAFVYLSCSGMALLDWVIVDQHALPFTRGKATLAVVEACKEYAKSEGKKVLYTVTANKSLIASFERVGFEKMEQDATTMALSLDGTKTEFLR